MAEEYSVLTTEEADDAFTPGDRRDDAAFEAEVKERIYTDTLAEIDRLRDRLKYKHGTLAGVTITPEVSKRGHEILDRRLAVAEAEYRGDPLPSFEPLEPLGQETGQPVKVLRPKPKKGPRWDAETKGLKYYIPGKPCRRGHSKRLTSTGACPECAAQLSVIATARRRERRKAAAPV